MSQLLLPEILLSRDTHCCRMMGTLWRKRLTTEKGIFRLRRWAKRAWTFPELTAMLLRRTWLSFRGCRLGSMTVVSALRPRGRLRNLRIGDRCIIGRVEIHLLDQVVIGDDVVVNDGARLLTGSHDVHDPAFGHMIKPIHIHDWAWVATSAIILPGVTIGEGAVVGAGAVVTRDVAPREIVAGNPAVPMGFRRVSEFRYAPYRNSAAIEAWLGPMEN